MEVFEFSFNPQRREDVLFESFHFQPKEPFEKRLGHLFVFSVLKNYLPQNMNFLKELSQKIRTEFYQASFSKTKIALKEALKRTNEFLQEKLKEGKVDWLGNFSCIIFAIKDFSIYFTKAGEIKILLKRGKKLVDIGEKLKLEDLEPYPLRLFTNIIVSNFTQDDILFIFTEEIFKFFQSEGILEAIKERDIIEGKEISQILESKEETMKNLFGISLAIFFKEKDYLKESFSFSEKRYFSFKEVFLAIFSFFKELFKEKTPPLFQRVRISQPPVVLETIKKERRKNFLIIVSIFLLVVGFFFVKYNERKKINYYQKFFSEIEKEISVKDQEELRKNLTSSLKKIDELRDALLPKELKPKYFSLKEMMGQKLKEIYKFKEIKAPEIFFDISKNNIDAKRILISKGNVFLVSNSTILKINQNKEVEEIKIRENPHLVQDFKEKIVLFYLPNSIYFFDKDKIEIEEIPLPSFPFNFDDISTFGENIYFLDRESGEILKYQKTNQGFSLPQTWIKDEKEKNAISFSVDSNIWLINGKNEILKYYQGRLKEKIKLDIFPEIKKIKKIFTRKDLNYLYLLEPEGKRIIVLDKKGKVVTQISSDKFKTLVDFDVFPKEKEILILDQNAIYKVEIPFD
jgi:hypothetical protein